MHEMSLFKDLMQKIESVARENEGKRIVRLRIILGAFSHLSPAHFQSHFDCFSKGTAAEGAQLEIIEDKDERATYAHGVILDSLDVEA